jgi:CheY-like chemotaxis protein
MIRVLLVDDDALVRSGLRMMLAGAPGLDVVGEAADGREVLGAVDLHRPDVVLMDIRMPCTARCLRGGAWRQPARAMAFRWYVRPALRARGVAAVCLLAVAGCGGGERQDENEPEGNFPVEVVQAKFPENQKLAKSSDLVVTVRNAGRETIPNIAMTVNGLDERKKDPDLADPTRPVFALNGVQVEIAGFPEAKDASPRGCDTAYVNTWACGPLKPNQQRTFRWSVTAVKAGDFKINWRVAAGLDGKAKAVAAGGGPAPRGQFSGTISDEAPDVRVADDGHTIVNGTR